MLSGADEVLSGFLIAWLLSTVILLAWGTSWWRPRLRPGVVAAVGFAAGVVAVVAGVLVSGDAEGGLSSVPSASAVLLLNGIVATWVSTALLLVTGIVALVRWARRTDGAR